MNIENPRYTAVLEADGSGLTCQRCSKPVVAVVRNPPLYGDRLVLRALPGWETQLVGAITLVTPTKRAVKGHEEHYPGRARRRERMPVLATDTDRSRAAHGWIVDPPAVVVCGNCGNPNRIDHTKLGAATAGDFPHFE